MFYVGQRVVYIGPDVRDHADVIAWGINVPIPNGIYTIRSGRMISQIARLPGYLLREIRNPIIPPLTHEFLIDESMLRPVVDTKTEVSFTTGADPSSEQFDNRRKQPARKQRA